MAPELRTASAAVPMHAGDNAPGWSVVVLDDSAVNRAVYTQLIRAALDDAEVHAFTSPTEALDWLAEHTPDLVVTDFRMPGLDGAEFVSRLRAQAADENVPVVVLTAYDDRESRKRALHAGATDYLTSPVVDVDEFGVRVSNLAQLGRQQRLLRQHASSLADELGESEASRQKALRESTARLAQVIDSVPAAISATGQDGTRIFANATASHVEARHEQASKADEWRRADRSLDQHVLATGESLAGYEEEVAQPDGQTSYLLTSKVPLRDEMGRITGVLTTSLDISARKRAELRLRQIAQQDSVTGVASYDHFRSQIERLVAQGRRGDKDFALHYVDLDVFKRVKDGYGHHVGDALQKEIARRLVGVVGASGLVGRLGGDGFGIVQQEGGATTYREAADLAERVIAEVSRPTTLVDTKFHATASIGIALLHVHGRSCDDLLRNADLAMFRAKLDGANRYSFAEKASDRAVDGIEDGLRRALEHGQFVMCWQRKFEAHSGLVIGVEALPRWRRPGWGLTVPGVFLATAERTGLAVPIAHWVLGQVCAQAAALKQVGVGPVRLCVDVSPSQALDPEFAASVRSTVEAAGVAPEFITLEFTEAMLAEAKQPLLRQIAELHEAGFGIGCDDFGVSSAGAGLVQRMPLQAIRVDQFVVRRLGKDDEADEIVAKAAELGRVYGVEVAADGVETADQRDRLRVAGIAVLQGPLLAQPESAESLVESLSSSTSTLVAQIRR